MPDQTAPKLLLVDANAKALKLLEFRFSQEGYQVFTATCAKDAVVTAIIVKPDIVISDLKLSDLSGIELKRILRSITAMMDVPVIFLSREKDLPEELVHEPGPPTDHLQKPYTFKELLSKVALNLKQASPHKLIPKKSAPRSGVLREVDLIDLIRGLSEEGRSCTLTLSQGQAHGEIYFIDGRVVDARSPQSRAQEAFYDLLAWQEAHYEIQEGSPEGVEQRITKELEWLIAEGLKELAVPKGHGEEGSEPAASEDPERTLAADMLPPEPPGGFAQLRGTGGGMSEDQGDEQRFLMELERRGVLQRKVK